MVLPRLSFCSLLGSIKCRGAVFKKNAQYPFLGVFFPIKHDIRAILVHVEQFDKSIWKESISSLLLSDKHYVSDSLDQMCTGYSEIFVLSTTVENPLV